MTAEHVGPTNVRHVQQPEGTELCFPALMSSMSDATLEEAHAVLKDAGISAEDGTTGLLMGKVELDLAGTEVTIEPMEIPEDAAGAIDAMEVQFAADKGILMLYKKTADSKSEDHHWVLLTGFARHGEEEGHNGHRGRIHVIDPLREETALLSDRIIGEMVARSTDYENGGQGIYAYSVVFNSGSAPEPRGKLVVVPAYDREPEPIEDTYTATKQDQAVSRD